MRTISLILQLKHESHCNFVYIFDTSLHTRYNWESVRLIVVTRLNNNNKLYLPHSVYFINTEVLN